MFYLSGLAECPDGGTPAGPPSYPYKGKVVRVIGPVTCGHCYLVNGLTSSEDPGNALSCSAAGQAFHTN